MQSSTGQKFAARMQAAETHPTWSFFPEKPSAAEMMQAMMPSAMKMKVPTINGVGMPMIAASGDVHGEENAEEVGGAVAAPGCDWLRDL